MKRVEAGSVSFREHLGRMAKTTKHESAATASGGANKADVKGAAAGGRRILVADDNAATCKQLQELLSGEPGVVVDTVGDGREALAALLERPYGIIITDLKMPRLSGMDLIAEVQKRHLPV